MTTEPPELNIQERPRLRLRLIAWLVAAALTVTGCDRPDADADPAARLQALGYVEWVEVDEKDGGDGVRQLDPLRYAAGLNLVNSRLGQDARIVDMEGRTLHRWTVSDPDDRWFHAELAPTGELLVITNGRSLQSIDPDSRVLWSNPLGAHHDLDVDALGRIFALRRLVDEVVWRGQPLRIVDEGIAILTPDGELERTIWLDRLLREYVDPAVLDAAVEKQRALAARLRRHLGLARLDEQGADVYHANSIDVLDSDVPGLGQEGDVLVSLRELDLLVVVDVAAEKIRWLWGSEQLDGPHHASVLVDGNVLVFDNGRRRRWSRVIEVTPDGDIIWEYSGRPENSLFSPRLGGCQKLWNGNVLVVESERGRALEVSPTGDTVWEYLNPERDETGERRRPIERMTRISFPEWRSLSALFGRGA